MLGRDCMIAPVYEQNALGRHVYLPEDMLLVRFRSAQDFDLVPVPAGHCWINLQLNEFPLFIRKGHVVPLSAGGECVAQVDWTHFALLGWLEDDVDVMTDLYNDDGVSTHLALEGHVTPIRISVSEGKPQAEAEGLSLDVTPMLVD